MQFELPNSLYGLAPVLVMGVGIGVFYASIEGWLYLQRRRRIRSPLTKGLLRGPGESLRKVLDDKMTDVTAYMLIIFIGPLSVFAIHLSQSYIGGEPETVARISISVILAIGMCIYGIVKLIRLYGRIRNCQLGLECELSVGQELNRLEGIGFRVFHDIPADKFNIDHVVVGPTGVFAVETKGRSKPMRGKGGEDARVTFDGKSLQFPTWVEKAPIDQARRQAVWLHKWLSQAVAENIGVIPVLALPGWYVNQTSRSDMPVYNGAKPERLFPEYGKAKFDSLMIRRIAHQLDQRCRDVMPKSDRHTKPEEKKLMV